MICSCFGHRKLEITDELLNQLYSIYEDWVANKGFTHFYFGGYGEFDNVCYDTVKKLKQKYSQIKLIFVRPYYKDLQQEIIDLYKKDYDDCIYLEPTKTFGKLAIIYRNYKIVDKSDFIIFYVTENNKSGSFKVFKYAKKLNKNYINLFWN